ncbi:MAG: MATE family efflux transporter, partial [Promicromonosporaceae bacterium]|nr:MATE family efflux transporter [Promicromonosporaceae bacterium]
RPAPMRNLTTGSPIRVILTFSLPLLLGNLFQQAYTLADSAIVGRMLGIDALAAVGGTGKMAFLIIGFSWGATAGLAIPVARAFGADDDAAVRRNIAASGIIALLIAGAITATGVIFGDALLRLVNTPPELFAAAHDYQAVMFGTASLTVIYNWLAAVIRALGDSRTPLMFLIFASVSNIFFSMFFVGPANLGVAGASWGTALAQGVSIVGCLWYCKRRMAAMFPTSADLRDGLHHLGVPARIGLPMGFQMSVIGIGTVVLQAAINGLGPDAVAAATVSARLEGLATAPLNTFGVAMATFVAQNYGAKAYRRIREAVFQMSIVSVIVAFALGGLQLLFINQLIALFTAEAPPQVYDMVRTHFQISLVMYWTLAILFIVRNTVQAVGATAIPTAAGFFELGLRSGAGLLLAAPLGWVGVVWGNPAAWAGACLLCSVSWFAQRRKLLALEGASNALSLDAALALS